VKLVAAKVKKIAEARGVSREQLAAAVERTGLEGETALRAINNWLNGRDHPRCKAADLRKIAAALGVAVKDVARFTSEVRYHRGSTRKARLLTDLVRGKNVDEALNLLRFTPKRAAVDVRKALSAALADAELAEADVTRLFVVESRCDEGPRLKRFQPKDRGRAHAIIKAYTHITIGVEEKA
jgi:large subunit ribosomal protein L22